MDRLDFLKGADVSSLHALEGLGARFRDGGRERDLLEILRSYGVNAVRLRLWNDPRAETGESYGGGGNDLATTIALARRVKARGMLFLLDLHYSDFWADPQKQLLPKAWRGFDRVRLEDAVHDFTAETLSVLRDAGVLPDLVQVGNEVTNGLLWPHGKRPDFPAMARLLSAGVRAVRAASPAIRVMIHLDNGGNNAMYREWFDRYLERGEDFDVMGLSYYPYWHGSLDDLERNLHDMAGRYGKDLVVVETASGFTTEDYAEREGLAPHERRGMVSKPELVARVQHPLTIQGQCDFVRDLVGRVRRVPGDRGKGFFWWEPAWLPVRGGSAITAAGQRYTGEAGAPGGNEWANQALFDYDGNALPALQVIRDS